MNEPLVSVVVITYNHEPYIKECLDGIISQKTDFPIEILVNDDCSTDNTSSIIKEYELKYPILFRCIYQTENQYSKGVHPWFDILFPTAKGKYIALCEGDDYWTDPYKLQKQVGFMETNPDLVAIYHNAFQKIGEYRNLFITPNNTAHYISNKELLVEWKIPTASLLFKKENLNNNAYNLRQYINSDYALELFLKSQGKLYYDDSIMSVYRMHSDSMSANLNNNAIMMYLQIIKLLEDAKCIYMEDDHNYFDKAIEKYKTLIAEIMVLNHPLRKWFNSKTYKRWIKKKMNKILYS